MTNLKHEENETKDVKNAKCLASFNRKQRGGEGCARTAASETQLSNIEAAIMKVVHDRVFESTSPV